MQLALFTDKTCAQCGKPYSNNGGYKYCSKRCRKRASNQATKQCVMCGTTFTADNYRSKACPSCARDYATEKRRGIIGTYAGTCRTCGSAFTANACSAKYCGPGCNPRQQPTPPHPCPECGTPGVQRPRKYCTATCGTTAALRRINKRVTDLYALACTLDIHGMDWRRRLYAVLIERDGPNCYLCGTAIDTTIKSGPKGNDTGPSIDHVHPRSKGGTDQLENLRLTHWGCNRAKSANLLGEPA